MPAPYTLWEETLLSGDTAKVIISPWVGEVGVIMHWNGALHSFERVPTIAHAERQAWQLHAQVLGGELGTVAAVLPSCGRAARTNPASVLRLEERPRVRLRRVHVCIGGTTTGSRKPKTR